MFSIFLYLHIITVENEDFKDNDDVRKAYNLCIANFTEFRSLHLQIATT